MTTTDRTVTHAFDMDALTTIQEATDTSKVFHALGYLSTWSPVSYPFVTIWVGGGEIVANYRREQDGPIGYTIGAVWHDGHFGFHS